MAMVSGDLAQPKQQELRRLLNEFAVLLEEEARKNKINIFALPLFKEFSILAATTQSNIIYAISPNPSGVRREIWLDWTKNPTPPVGRDLASAIQQQLGWTSVSIINFGIETLEDTTQSRERVLRSVANESVQSLIREVERQMRIVRLNPIFKGRDFLVENNLSFVLMPFREPFIRLYKDHIKPALESEGYRVMRADDIFTPTPIIEDIWEYINRASIIVADVTGKNPNVFYELGLAHTVGKDVVMLTQNEEDIPFDLRHLRYFTYLDNQEGWNILKEKLAKAVNAIRDTASKKN